MNLSESWSWNFCKERRVYPDKWGEMILFFRDEPKHDNPLVLVIITMICNVDVYAFHEGSYIDAIKCCWLIVVLIFPTPCSPLSWLAG